MSDLESLIRRLSPDVRQAMERAAARTRSETHYNVEIEHLLLELVKSPTGLGPVLKRDWLSPEIVANELESSLLRFDRGNSRTPVLSPHLLQLLERAWLVSTLRLGAKNVPAAAILLALLEKDPWRSMAVQSSPTLGKIPLDSLIERASHSARTPSPKPRPRAPKPPETSPAPTTTRTQEDPRDEPAGYQPKGEAKAFIEEERRRQAAAQDEARAHDDREEGREIPIEDELPADSALARYTQDLTAEAKAGRIDPIRGRDSEIRQVIDILSRRRQNNPILVGDAGVGKTAVVEGLALRIANGSVPSALRDISLRVLDLGLLQAGAGVRGAFEERLKAVIQEVARSSRPVILFIDEAHTLIGAGGSAGQGDAANLLKPALARGELRTIAATTWSEYKRYVEKDPALTRRFQLVKIEEPSEEKALEMLRAVSQSLESHHGIRILDEAISAAVRLSTRYLAERRLPDKAVSVLDTACARVSLARDERPQALQDLTAREQRVGLELDLLRREERTGADHGPAIAQLRGERNELTQRLQRLEQAWKKEQSLAHEIQVLEAKIVLAEAGTDADPGESGKAPHPELGALLDLKARYLEEAGEQPLVPWAVNAQVVAEVIAEWTGIPVGEMRRDEVDGILELASRLRRRVIGQDAALDAISRRVATARAGLEDPSKPKGVFLLAGPSGVGKTESALALAAALFGDEESLLTLNMSEFQEAHSVATLRGAPPGYVGYGEGGVLTEAVRRRPYRVILLDEVEKAHRDVLEVFYQVFDKGRLEDGEGVPVDFKHTLILLTSNVASEIIEDICASGAEKKTRDHGSLVETIYPELLRHFPQALLGRLVVVPYRPLGRVELRRIVDLKLRSLIRRLADQHQAELVISQAVADELSQRAHSTSTGARAIDHLLTQSLLPELSQQVLTRMAERKPFERAEIDLDTEGRFTVAMR